MNVKAKLCTQLMHPTYPNPEQEAERVVLQAEVGGTRVGVFFCGNPAAKHTLAKLCAQANKTGSTKFIFHAEHF